MLKCPAPTPALHTCSQSWADSHWAAHPLAKEGFHCGELVLVFLAFLVEFTSESIWRFLFSGSFCLSSAHCGPTVSSDRKALASPFRPLLHPHLWGCVWARAGFMSWFHAQCLRRVSSGRFHAHPAWSETRFCAGSCTEAGIPFASFPPSQDTLAPGAFSPNPQARN